MQQQPPPQQPDWQQRHWKSDTADFAATLTVDGGAAVAVADDDDLLMLPTRMNVGCFHHHHHLLHFDCSSSVVVAVAAVEQQLPRPPAPGVGLWRQVLQRLQQLPPQPQLCSTTPLFPQNFSFYCFHFRWCCFRYERQQPRRQRLSQNWVYSRHHLMMQCWNAALTTLQKALMSRKRRATVNRKLPLLRLLQPLPLPAIQTAASAVEVEDAAGAVPLVQTAVPPAAAVAVVATELTDDDGGDVMD